MAELRFESDELTLRSHHPAVRAAALALMVLGPALAIALAQRILPAIAAAPLSVLAGMYLWSANPAPIEQLGRVLVSPLGIFFNGRRIAARSKCIVERIFVQEGDAPIVRVRTSWGPLEFRVKDAAEAHKLAAAISDRGPRERIVRLPSRVFSEPARFARFGIYAVLLTLAFPIIGLCWRANHAVALVLLASTLASVGALLTALLADTIVAVTPKGVRVRWLRRERFIAHGDIETVRLEEELADLTGGDHRRVLSLGLRSGQTIRLPCEAGAGEALYGMLSEVRRALPRSESTADDALARAGRDPAAWIRHLRALGRGDHATHRRAPVREETLWNLVEDQAASLETRAAAAIALLSSGGEETRTRLRIAALEAAPRLRVALESAVEATSDDDLERALSEVIEREPREFLTEPAR